MTSYGLDEWFWVMFEPTPTLPNLDFGQLFMWIGANDDQIWLPMGSMSESEKCSNSLQRPNFTLVNFSCELVKKWPDMTFYWLDEWFRTMFEITPIWPNFTFRQLFMWIGANNYRLLYKYNILWPRSCLGRITELVR